MAHEDNPPDMGPHERKEIHRIQLAQTTDRLVTGADFLDIWANDTIRDAEELLRHVGDAATRLAAN